MSYYSLFKLNLDGSLSHRENLDELELGDSIMIKYGIFATIKVIRDDGRFVIYTDNGVDFEVAEKGFCDVL